MLSCMSVLVVVQGSRQAHAGVVLEAMQQKQGILDKLLEANPT